MTSNLATHLVTKLTVSNRLDGQDVQAIQHLPILERRFGPYETLVADGSRPTECCLLAEGFAVRAKVTPDGNRQVLSIHIPGEIPDLQSLYLGVMDHELSTLTPCTVGFIPHEAVKTLTRERPNVAAAMWRETLIDAAIFREWIVNVGRRSAAERMAHLLLEVHRRLTAIGRVSHGEFGFPITQAVLGDCLGLSTVHVNRTLQALRDEGLIQVNRSNYHILKPEALQELAGFDATYLHLGPAI
jgi:CRP-like cAMP-binding protein